MATHHFQHVVIIVLENTDVETARKIDYFRQLAAEGASFADFHGVTHPSYSNYLAMVAGQNIFSLWDIQRNLDECLIADLLHAKGLTWKNYAEGYPEPSDPQMPADQCFTGDRLGGYARKHVPFMSFIRVQQKQCGNIVSASAFASDRASGNLPNYAFYSPDLDHDGHDTGIAKAAIWLQGFLDPLHADGAWPEDTLIVVTFDEFGRSIIELRQSHLYRAARQHDQAGHDHPRAARSLRRVADDRGQFRALLPRRRRWGGETDHRYLEVSMPLPMKRHSFVRRLGFAMDGIRAAWRRERNFRIQLVFAGALVGLLLALRPGFYWAAIFLMVAALVLSAEMINSALEALIDHLHPDIHPEIRIIKDMAAGAVLVFSLTALLIAALFAWQTWLV